MLVDTHCHLDAAEFDGDRDAVADAAMRAGVELIVVPSVERANFGAVASVCRDYSGCVAAYGIHPMYVERAREADLDALRETVLREHPLAVGEIGLDHFVETRDEAQQDFYFSAQLRIARDNDLPVLLHVRRAIRVRLVALVGRRDHDGAGPSPESNSLEHMGRTHHVGGEGIDGRVVGVANQGLRREVQHYVGIRGGERPLNGRAVPDVASDVRGEHPCHATELEIRGPRGGIQREPVHLRAATVKPERKPAPHEPRVTRQPDPLPGERAHHFFHGARPEVHCRSRASQSRGVSMHCQKPSCS